jgi:DNA-directed RNA polymerase specialized sigma24 family protein
MNEGRPTDAELHALILAGDEAALAVWEDRVRPDVLRMLANDGTTPEDAEEIWQEALFATWARLMKDPPLSPPGESLRAYSFRVASNIAGRMRGARATSLETVPLIDETDEPSATSIATVDSARVLLLRDCIQQGSERIGLVAKLLMEQISRRQLATALGIAETSVGQIVARTKKVLADCVEKGSR